MCWHNIWLCFLRCRWLQSQLLFTGISKKYFILYFQDIYCSIVLEEIRSIVSMFFLYMASCWHYTNLTFVSYETTLQTWSFDFSHIISQKHSIDFYLCQHKHQCYMFILLKWAVAVEEIEKQRDTVITSAQIARCRMVPTTALLKHSFLLYWSLALGLTGNLALAKSSHFPAEKKKKEYKTSFVLCLHLHRPA